MKKAKRGKKEVLWLIGQTASYLCLIHCIATVAVTFLAPSLLRLLPHNYWVEAGAWAFVLISSLFLLSRAPYHKWHYFMLLLFALTGTTMLFLHNHQIFAGTFMGLALFQLYLTLSHHLSEHSGDDKCCQHPHHHHHEPHDAYKGHHK